MQGELAVNAYVLTTSHFTCLREDVNSDYTIVCYVTLPIS